MVAGRNPGRSSSMPFTSEGARRLTLIFPLGNMSARDDLRRACRAAPPADPRSAARRGALGRRPRRAAHVEPARRLQAPQGAARGGARRGPQPGQAAPLRAALASRSRRSMPGSSPTARTGRNGSTRSNDTWRRTHDRRDAGDHRRAPGAALRAPAAVPGAARLARRHGAGRARALVRRAGAVDARRSGRPSRARVRRGEITALEEPLLLAWSWGDERYSFELRPDGDGCVLVFTHVFDARYGPAAQHAAGWETYLARLAAHLAGGHLSERGRARRDRRAARALRRSLRSGSRARSSHDREHGLPRRDARGRPAAAPRAPLSLSPIERVWRAISEPDELRAVVSVRRSARRDRARRAAPARRQLVRRRRCASSCGPTATAALLVFTHAFADRDTAARTGSGLGSLLRPHRRAARRPADERGRVARALARRPRALRADLRRRSRARSQELRASTRRPDGRRRARLSR